MGGYVVCWCRGMSLHEGGTQERMLLNRTTSQLQVAGVILWWWWWCCAP